MIDQELAGRYRVLSELGSGGMGVVYRARDPRLNRDVAIKLIPPALLTPESEQRFQNEAQVVAQMDHPAIVPIYDFGRHESSMFFVMPVVEGTSLRQLLRETTLTLGDLIDIGVQVAEALDYSHAREVVHRDIKPENLMITREEGAGLRVRVMDFGLARSTNVSRMTKTGTLVGTVAYLSPEQISGKGVDHRSDIYALGTVLYECLASDVPFSGDLQAVLYRIVHELPQPPRERGASVDEALEAIVLSCLVKDPAKRPQKASELVKSLKSYRADLHDSEQLKSVMLTRTMALPRPALAPFVGREDELKELQTRLNGAIAGKCHFIVVSGEPGVGKTRLLDELETLARAREIRVLHGRFVEQEAAFPYYGFCEIIQDYYQQKESGSSSSALPDLSDLASDLVSLFPMLSEIEPIRSAAGGESQLARPAEARSPENRNQIFELVARTLTRLAGGKPLLLFFEELHGADASIEAMQYVVRRLAPTPTLVVGTYRSNEIDRRHPLTKMLASFRGDRQFTALKLEPLSLVELRAFLSTLVGGSEVDEIFAKRLFEASEGNPFFAKELVRSLLDSGSIVQDDSGAWALSGGTEISSESLPATIQQAVEERIGRLPDDLREILSTAAVTGRTFDFRDLETLLPDEDDLDDAVDRLVHEGLIEEDRQSRGDRLAFSSGVVRDVLYGELSRRRRRSLHRKFAKVLEKRHAGRLEGAYPQLVYHFAEGDVAEKTVEYGLLHAQKSLKAFSPDDATRSAKAALEYLDREWEGDRSLEGEARMLLAAAHQMGGEVSAALREIESAVKVFERENKPEPALEALLTAAQAAWQARRSDVARRWVERGMELSRTSNSNERLAEFLSLAATLASLRGEHVQANEYLQEADRFAPAVSRGEATEIPSGGRLTVGLANPVAATHPANLVLIEDWEVFPNVFEPLVSADESGNLLPSLCEKWEARDGGKSFVLTLRAGVCFQDGTELTADEVKRSFERSIRETTLELAAGFAAIEGVDDYAQGKSDQLDGIVAMAPNELEVRLGEPLPIYPALLTDGRMGIHRTTASEQGASLVGTGPFRLTAQSAERVVLERHPDYWKGSPPNLDTVEYRPGLVASELANGLRSGELDVVGDLLPQDLEALLREPRFRTGLFEAPKKLTCFVLFNTHTGPLTRKEKVRQALAGVIRTQDLVWQHLGRFAQPTTCLLPPGVLGHNPGRRRRTISVEEGRKLLDEAGLPEEIRLQASVHPVFQDSNASLLQAIFDIWAEMGIEVTVQTDDMPSFRASWQANDGIDLMFTRWAADYDDPDNFTHTHFNSRTGQLRAYFSSDESDELLDQARTEAQPGAREDLYRKYENLLQESAALAPLFNDVDYRVASPQVRGLTMRSFSPNVNYAELGKAETAGATVAPVAEARGRFQIPMSGVVVNFDPAWVAALEQNEVLPNVYETLTRGVGDARIDPWLAEHFYAEEGGTKYRFRLRDGVRFHDGRRLTVRDVRYSFERLLQTEGSHQRSMYSPIRGATAMLEGKASALTGFHIHSARDFTIELEKPVSFFPALIAYTAASIVPEGTERIGSSWKEGAVGTGPFRVVRFEPGKTLELERNPSYWREGYPRCQGVVFNFGVPSNEILSGFRSGRFSVAADLFPSDLEALRRDADLATGYREKPRLTTFFVAFNIHAGALEVKTVRQRLIAAFDTPSLVRQTLGALAIPARGIIPPGLLGHEAGENISTSSTSRQRANDDASEIELVAAIHPIFEGEFSALKDGIVKTLGEAGFKLRSVAKTVDEYADVVRRAKVDVLIGRWNADYLDTDAFVHVTHTREGWLGSLCGTPEMDELIERGRVETDPATRHGLYRQVEEILRRDARIMPLFHEQTYRFARPEVEGLSVSYWFPIVAYDELRLCD